MRALIALLIFLSPIPALAQYVKPDIGGVTITLPDGRIAGVFATQTLVGDVFAAFEKNPVTGQWYGWAGNGTAPSLDLAGDIAAKGGVTQYILANLSIINAALTLHFGGGVPATIPVDPVGQINVGLSAQFILKMVNGVPALATR